MSLPTSQTEINALLEQAHELYERFLQRYDLSDTGEYYGFDDQGFQYQIPKKIKYVTIDGEKVFVSYVVKNARMLLQLLDENRDTAQRQAASLLHLPSNQKLSPQAMWELSLQVGGCIRAYYFDALRHVTNFGLTEEHFTPMETLVCKYVDALDREIGHICTTYEQMLANNKEEAANLKESLDRRTEGLIANAPRYVQIEGRFKDGLFGPKFEGRARSWSTMSQADVINSYIGNSSSARVNQQLNDGRAMQRAIGRLNTLVNEALPDFMDKFIRELYYHVPKFVCAKTLTSSSYDARPYLPENVMKMVDLIDSDDLFKIKVIVDYYKVDDFLPALEKRTFENFLYYFHEENDCLYDGMDQELLLYLTDRKSLLSDPRLQKMFAQHFDERLEKEYQYYLHLNHLEFDDDDDCTVLFEDLLDDADDCLALAPADYEALSKKVEQRFEQLKKERPRSPFGSSRKPAKQK